jgi:4-amino-4-deoxy-L-arabinose transferase-like glycosyltransferase
MDKAQMNDTVKSKFNMTNYVFWALISLCALRIGLIFTTYIELYPDEAQYWLWSRKLDFGYYSKPPMIAWVIHLTTALGGNSEPFVRLLAPILHLGSALILWATGRKLFDNTTGMIAAMVYSLMPGVVLSSAVISTDAPLMFFLSISLYFYACFLKLTTDRLRLLSVVWMALSFGAAFLSKYACIYFLIGVIAHALWVPQVRKLWSWKLALIFIAALLVIISPNIYWNIAHGFQTVSHTADNANWKSGSMFNPSSLFKFWGDQFGVFGPVPFLILLIGITGLIWRSGPILQRNINPDHQSALLGLFALSLPPLIIVTVQAFLSRANANWAASAYVPASLLVAALWQYGFKSSFISRLFVRPLPWVGGAFQVTIVAIFMLGTLTPELTQALGMNRSVNRSRGWEATTKAVISKAESGSLPSAILVDNRNIYNALAYYGRDWWAKHPNVPLKAWVRGNHPKSQAETEVPLTPEVGQDVLVVSYVKGFVPEICADFLFCEPKTTLTIAIDPKRKRQFTIFRAKDYNRAMRDPKTGLPKSKAELSDDEP